eukprot:1176913-Prorocentrum_minimum.AAC.3
MGALMARQMENAQKTQAKEGGANKVSSHEKLRLQIIDQYRRKRGRMPQPPVVSTLPNRYCDGRA